MALPRLPDSVTRPRPLALGRHLGYSHAFGVSPTPCPPPPAGVKAMTLPLQVTALSAATGLVHRRKAMDHTWRPDVGHGGLGAEARLLTAAYASLPGCLKDLFPVGIPPEDSEALTPGSPRGSDNNEASRFCHGPVGWV